MRHWDNEERLWRRVQWLHVTMNSWTRVHSHMKTCAVTIDYEQHVHKFVNNMWTSSWTSAFEYERDWLQRRDWLHICLDVSGDNEDVSWDKRLLERLWRRVQWQETVRETMKTCAVTVKTCAMTVTNSVTMRLWRRVQWDYEEVCSDKRLWRTCEQVREDVCSYCEDYIYTSSQ